MNYRQVIITALVLWCCGVYGYTSSENDRFTIAAPVTQPDSVYQLENDIIRSSIDTVLTPVYSLHGVSCRPGELLVRKKHSEKEYRFYRGVLDTVVFNQHTPFFIFELPKWARVEDFITYRMYHSPTESIGDDELVVYFDHERMYSRTRSKLFYYRNGIWFPLLGSQKKPFGILSVTSVPSGAEVVLNGVSTGSYSPCTITNLIGGEYSVELTLSHHKFFTKTVRVVPDSTIDISFELITDVDTVFITGEVAYSLLLLPQPPEPYPYTIDDSITLYASRIRVSPGEHSIQWQGSKGYATLDTVVVTPVGRVCYFDYQFRLKYGMVRIYPKPFDAQLCIEGRGCGTGERVEELPVGVYRVDAYRQGFAGLYRDIAVRADTVITYTIDLRQVPDSDGDGYIDSVDYCPAQYGLYNGCATPRFWPVVSSVIRQFTEFVEDDPFTVAFSLLGIVSKSPTNKTFRGFLSVFSDGRIGGVNNYKGINALNAFTCSWRGLFLSGELGQWASGIRYRQADTLYLDKDNYFYYDSLFGVKPALYIPTTALSFGVHYNKSWLDVAYAVGYQWEDIIIHSLYNSAEQQLEKIVFNNDWWYHLLRLEVDFDNGDRYVPSLYMQMKYPFGVVRQTRWTVFNAGLQLKVISLKKE